MKKKNDKEENLPLITVAIATYNSRRTIEKCLRSIKKQTYPNLEIVVVDSPFYKKEEQVKCEKIIKKYARLFKDGPERSVQRNRGIKEARGEYVLVIDQDMYLMPEVATECYQTIKRGDCIALTIPEISVGKGFWTECVALERYVSTYLEKGMNECSRFFRKKDAMRIGGYDESIVGIEDSDFHYRMAEKGKIGKIKNYIYHDEGKIEFFDRVKKKFYYSRVFREYLKRRPGVAAGQFFPIKKAYFKHWKLFAQKPLVTLGVIALRSTEVIAGFLGLIIKKEP